MLHNLKGMFTIMQRETSRFLRVWTQTLVPPIITSTLFILIFGYSLGSRISSVANVSYLEFILPGLFMMSVIMSAYTNTLSSLYIAKFQGNIQELLVAPISYWQIIIGTTAAAVLRAVLVGIGVLIVGYIFTPLSIMHWWIVVYFVLTTCLLFAFAGIATALWATNFDKMNIFSTFVITPLTYLGGVFYSISMLPLVWQSVARFNPILYMVDGLRYGFLGFSDISVGVSMSVVFVLMAGFFLLCVWMFKTGYKLRS